MADNFGSSFTIDISQLKQGLAQANALIRESESKFKAAAAGMQDWTKEQGGLEARIKHLNNAVDLQQKKVDALTEEYERQIADGLNPASKAAVDMRTAINKEQTALNKNKTELAKQKTALKELGTETKNADKKLDKLEDTTKEVGDGFTIAKGAIADFISDGLQNLIGSVKNGISSLLGLAEETRELRTNMAKLETSFEDAGFSAETASDTYKEFYGILGDEGQATEAVAHLSALAKNEEDLAKWTDIATGVYAKFGASLPIENLTEAANETSKTGQLTGGLADALNWVGIEEEKFQEKLDKCTTEQERQKLITDTLQGAYSDLADSYRENNQQVIDANKVQAEYAETMAQLGAIMEPIMTSIKSLTTEAIGSLTPFLAQMAEGVTGILSGTEGATDVFAGGLSGMLKSITDKIVEYLPSVVSTLITVITTLLPTIISAITALIPQLITSLTAQLPIILNAIVTGFQQVVSAVGEMLPTLIPVLIDAVLLIVETLLDNIDQIIDAGISLLMGLANGLVQALPQLVAKGPVIVEKLVSAISTNLPKILQAGVDILLKLGTGLVQAIPQLVSNIPTIWSSIIKGFNDGMTAIDEVGVNLIKGLWNGIKSMSSWISEKIRGFGGDVMDDIKDFFGIHSPSKLMEEEIGKNLALGIGEGFSNNIKAVNKEITGSMNFDTPATVNGRTASGIGSNNQSVSVVNNNYFAKAHTEYEIYKTEKQTEKSIKRVLKGAYA